jgi:hypothetical protein
MVTLARAARLAGADGRLVSVPVPASVPVSALVPVPVLPSVRVVVAPEVYPVLGGDGVALGLRLSDMRLANLTSRANGQSESAIIRILCVSGERLLVVLAARGAALCLDRSPWANVC